MTSEESRLFSSVVDLHVGEMVKALREKGFDVLGLAGGIMYNADDGSHCRSFWAPPQGLASDEGPVTTEEFVNVIAESMCRAQPEGEN